MTPKPHRFVLPLLLAAVLGSPLAAFATAAEPLIADGRDSSLPRPAVPGLFAFISHG